MPTPHDALHHLVDRRRPVPFDAALDNISIRHKLHLFALGTSTILTILFITLVWFWTQHSVQKDVAEEVRRAMNHFNFVEATRLRQDLREAQRFAAPDHPPSPTAFCTWAATAIHALQQPPTDGSSPKPIPDLLALVSPANTLEATYIPGSCTQNTASNPFPHIYQPSGQLSDWLSPGRQEHELVQVPYAGGHLVLGFAIDNDFAQRLLDDTYKEDRAGKAAQMHPMDIAIWRRDDSGQVQLLGFTGVNIPPSRVQSALQAHYGGAHPATAAPIEQFEADGYNFGNRSLGDQIQTFDNAGDLRVAVIQPLAPALAPFHQLELLLLALAALALFFGFLLGTLFSRPIAHPLMVLAALAKTVADGHLEAAQGAISRSTRHHAQDEIGTLERSFAAMVHGLRERLAMSTFLSRATYDHIRAGTDTPQVPSAAVGVRTSLAILFTDIRSFTAFSEHAEPEAVIDLLNQVLSIQAEIVERHGGDINKFIGDALFAWFAGPDRAQRALNASVEIVATLQTRFYNQPGTQIGIGIHLGDLVVGAVGSHDRKDFTAIGAVVNMASRLCSKAHPGQILLSTQVAAELPSQSLRPIEPLTLKGFTHPVPVFEAIHETRANSKSV